MNARVDLPAAREVCPTTTRRLLAEGALLVDVRERAEVARMAFDVPALVQMPLSEFERRFDELPRDRPLVLACESGPRSLKATYGIDVTVVNAENSADGNGITNESCDSLFDSGADILTTGNHVFRRAEVYGRLDSDDCVLRPANFAHRTLRLPPARGRAFEIARPDQPFYATRTERLGYPENHR